jgi:hypothetical protein
MPAGTVHHGRQIIRELHWEQNGLVQTIDKALNWFGLFSAFGIPFVFGLWCGVELTVHFIG